MTPVEVHPGGYARRWRALGVLCLALSIIVLDNTILETGSYAWPLPVVVVTALAVGSGVAWAFGPGIGTARATRRSRPTPSP